MTINVPANAVPRRQLPTRHVLRVATGPVLTPPQRPDSWQETMARIWRHRLLVGAVTLGIAGLSAIIVSALPSYYVAEARLLIGVPSPRVTSIEQLLADVSPDAERVQNESFVLQSRDLAKDVIAKLHLNEDPEINADLAPKSWWQKNIAAPVKNFVSSLIGSSPSRPARENPDRQTERMVDNLLSRVDVSTLGRSHVLSIRVSSRDPDHAALLANTLARSYLDLQRSEKVDTARQVEDFLQARIEDLRKQVQLSEQAVEDYRQKNGLYRTESQGIISQQLGELNSQLIQAETEKVEAEAKLREAESAKSAGMDRESVPSVLNSPLIQSLKERLSEADRHVAELAASYGDRHPAMIAARAEAADLRRKIRSEVAKTVDGLRNDARAAEARYAALTGSLDSVKREMGLSNDKSIHLEALERDAAVSRNLLEAAMRDSKQTGASQELQFPDGRLISTAAPPAATSYPPKKLIVVLATFGGLLIGVILALSIDSIDRTFRRPEDLEGATGLPLIACVPQLKRGLPPLAQVLKNPVSLYNESLRKINVSLRMADWTNPPRTVIVASATPEEGKTVLAASLGRLLAGDGKRVLLIDCDWRCPNVHRLFRCSNDLGLAALLNDEHVVLNDVIHQDALSGLDVIPAGEWDQNAVHLFTSDRMHLILQSFARNYDLVLLDTPPVLVGAEVLSLSRMVDKVLFAVHWGSVHRESVIDAVKQILNSQGEIAGCVFTRVDAERYRQYAHAVLDYDYGRRSSAVTRA